MKKKIFCVKLKENKEPLESQPFPGKLGEKILLNVSKEAWNAWLGYQTMLVNEKRLNLSESSARNYLQEQMQKFLFESGYDEIEGFNPK